LLFRGDEIEGFADGFGGLLPFDERLRGEAGGLDCSAGAGGVDASFFGAPEDLIVLFGAGVEERLHAAASKVAGVLVTGSAVIRGEVGDDGEGVGVRFRTGVGFDELHGLLDGGPW